MKKIFFSVSVLLCLLFCTCSSITVNSDNVTDIAATDIANTTDFANTTQPMIDEDHDSPDNFSDAKPTKTPTTTKPSTTTGNTKPTTTTGNTKPTPTTGSTKPTTTTGNTKPTTTVDSKIKLDLDYEVKRSKGILLPRKPKPSKPSKPSSP
jgi:hypothetical protein